MKDYSMFDFKGRDLGQGLVLYESMSQSHDINMVNYQLCPGINVFDIRTGQFYSVEDLNFNNRPNSYRIAYVKEGIYQTNMDDFEIQVTPDRVYLGHSYKACSYARSRTKKMRGLNIQIYPDDFDQSFFSKEKSFQRIVQALIRKIDKIVKNGIYTNDEDVILVARKVFDFFDARDSQAIFIAIAQLFYLISQIDLDDFFKSYHGSHRQALTQIGQVKDYIDKNSHKKLDLAHLMDRFSLSKTKLNQGFKAYTGMSPGDYVRMVKMGRAQDLLREEGTITEIAQDLGYTTSSNFSRAFKAYTGFSPTEFRKS